MERGMRAGGLPFLLHKAVEEGRDGGMEGRACVGTSQRCSCCAKCDLGWLVPLRSQSWGDTSNQYSEVPEGNWFGSVHSALAFCFLGANLPGGMGQIKVYSP